VAALVDTGASVSCVEWKVTKHERLTKTDYVRLIGANGMTLETVGCVQCQVEIQNQVFQQSFYVVKGLMHEMILGLDFLEQHNARLCCRDRVVEFPEKAQVEHNIIKIEQSAHGKQKLEYGVPMCVEQLFEEYPDILKFKAGSAKISPCHIEMKEGTRPVKSALRRKAWTEKDVIRREVAAMLELGVIRPSVSPWASPVQLVRKKDGNLRFCIDFRRVNADLTLDAFPTPLVDEVIDDLQGATVFSSLDLKSGYWQLPLDEASKEITAFATCDGLFEFNVLPFGLATASALFQRAMSSCLP